MYNPGFRVHRVSSKENRRPEDPLERGYQTPILFASFRHAEGVQHLGTGSEANDLALLLDRHRRKQNRHQTVLTERQAKFGVAAHLQNKMPVSSLI
jgi:hypothetical protein